MKRQTLLAISLLLTSGCTASPSPHSSAEAREHPLGAAIWAGKCGSCHVPVEPGTRDRKVFEVALRRHESRLRLAPAEWADVIEFLSPRPNPLDSTRDHHP